MLVMLDLKIQNITQHKVKVDAVRYKHCSETSVENFFGNFVNL